MIEAHFHKLRSIRQYANAFIYVYIEANMSFIGADFLHNLISVPEFAPLEVVSEDKTSLQRPGVWTGETEKEFYAKTLQHVLSDGMLSYAHDDQFVSQDPVNVKNLLVQQLRTYRKETKLVGDPAFGKLRVSYSGKSSGKKDDMSMVLQIALGQANKKRISADYRATAEAHGWR